MRKPLARSAGAFLCHGPSHRMSAGVSAWHALPSHDLLNVSPLDSLLISDGLATHTQIQEFEPVVDWAALGTFISIMTVALLLFRRTVAVEEAVMERETSLTLVRKLKSKALEVDDENDGEMEKALKRYEAAVIEEEKLRNIVPGVVRIVPPSASNPTEENARVAAKQFLGKDYDIGVPEREENASGKLPMVALGILVLLGLSLTALLIFLSIDPLTASSMLSV